MGHEGQHDLHFTVQLFVLYQSLFHVCISYFGIMNMYDPWFDLKINVDHFDLYYMVHWFCLIFWMLFAVWTSLFGIVNHYDPVFDLKVDVGHCDLYFMVQWLWVTSLRQFDLWTSYFGIMGQYDTFDLKINVGLSDLYFMTQWFCLISPNTIWCSSVIFSDDETMWPKLWRQINISQRDLYFMV